MPSSTFEVVALIVIMDSAATSDHPESGPQIDPPRRGLVEGVCGRSPRIQLAKIRLYSYSIATVEFGRVTNTRESHLWPTV